MAQPGQGPGPAVHQAEVIQHIEGLRGDRFALAGDQIAGLHRNGGDALLGDKGFNAALAQAGITAQIGMPLQRVRQEPCPEVTASGWQGLQLQGRRRQELVARHAG